MLNESGISADWHPLLYFVDKENLKIYEHNLILSNKGIKKTVAMLGNEKYSKFCKGKANLSYIIKTFYLE